MEYSYITEQLIHFLSEKDVIREVKSSSRIISFALQTDSLPMFNAQHHVKTLKNFFHFTKPSDNFSFTAAGELISINENGNGRWTAIDKKIKHYQSKIISNWENTGLRVPLFTGGMKFTVEHNDSDWKDFNDSNWIIPEIIFLSDNGRSYVILNFYYTRNSDINELTYDLEQKLKRLSLNSKEEETFPIRIYSANGQTPKDKKKWKNMVHKALENIYEKGIKKVVLSRKVEIMLNSEPSFDKILNDLEEKYPDCGIFMFKNNSSVFFGATPERLISFNGKNVLVDALAGSALNDSGLFSDKNLREHDFVIEYITNSLNPYIDKLELTHYHHTKKLNNISHIWSEIYAELKEQTSIFNTLKILFPTPAICGVPKEPALNLIKKLEDHRRGLYSGIIGWHNFNDAEFYVAIRSGLCTGKKIVAYAGCGIVDGSDAEDEFNETELKLIPILSLFKNENKSQPQYSLG